MCTGRDDKKIYDTPVLLSIKNRMCDDLAFQRFSFRSSYSELNGHRGFAAQLVGLFLVITFLVITDSESPKYTKLFLYGEE